MKALYCVLAAVAVLMVSFSPAGAAQSGGGGDAVVEKASNALQHWKTRPDMPASPEGCDRCSALAHKIGAADAQGLSLAEGMGLLMNDIKTVGFDRAGAAPLKQLDDATAQLESTIVQRDTLMSQYRSEIEKFKMRKWRPDDSKAREEMRYYNPTRPR